MKFFIVAGNLSEASLWIQERAKKEIEAGNSFNKSDYIYVTDATRLKGYSNPHGIFIGTWRDRKDILSIVDQLIIASHDHNPVLTGMREELWKMASNTQMTNAAVAAAAKRLADEIDAEVLRKVKPLDNFIVKVTGI